MAKKKGAAEKVLILRTCRQDLTSSHGYRYPESGPVEAPDWDPADRCGGGLHGWLWGEGDGALGLWDTSAKWLVIEADATDVVQITKNGGGKCKFRRGGVVHCGDQKSATDYLAARAPGKAIIGAMITAGYRGTATAGACGTATAGDYGTATAGDDGTATAGAYGTATAGAYGTATAGADGTATAGAYGTATAGYRGTATAGDYGTATAGDYGTATAGDGGTLIISWWDGTRRRVCIGYVGEDGIEPNVPYRVKDGKLAAVNS